MRFYLVSLADNATGGTELLHQFSKCLTDNCIENYMIYQGADGIQCPTPTRFLKYGVKYVSQYVDSPDSVLVLAETQINFAKECVKGTTMIWWLSVDNYIDAYRYRNLDNNMDTFGLKERQNVIHFVQSHYAKNFVNQHFTKDNCYFLMDYINDDIIDYALKSKNSYQRQNICLYNPKKGYETLEPIIAACRKDIQWIPLRNMTPTEMADIMCKAKLYVDFGAHPGKDRIPRETAICGCCILTNRKGSAAYHEDVKIPEKYKVENTGDINTVLEKIYDLVDNYGDRTTEYIPYREAIAKEKEEFMKDMHNAITILQEIALSKTPTMSPSQLLPHTELLDSIGSAALKINSLTADAKNACATGDSSKLMNDLLTIDYILQLVRETVYVELADIS